MEQGLPKIPILVCSEACHRQVRGADPATESGNNFGPDATGKQKAHGAKVLQHRIHNEKSRSGHARNGFFVMPAALMSGTVVPQRAGIRSVHCALTAGAAALVFLQVTLTQTDGLRRNFD